MSIIIAIGKLLGKIPYKEKFEMARNSSTPRAKKLQFAIKEDAHIKICIAHQTDIDPEIIKTLIDRGSSSVHFALISGAMTDHIPAEFLEELAEDPEDFIKNRARELLAQRIEKEGISFSFFCQKNPR